MKGAALLGLLALLAVPGDEPLVARAKEQEFTRADFGEWLVQRHGVDELDDYLVSVLVQRLAAERGLLPDEAAVGLAYQAEFDRIVASAHGGDAEAYVAALARRGYAPETWKRKRQAELRAELAQARLALADRPVTEERLRARFQDLFGDAGERVSLEVYFFSAYRDVVPGGAPPDVAALRTAAHERAAAARTRLLAGEAHAEVYAASEPVSSPQVQDGLVAGYRRLMLGREVDRALAGLRDPGETSPVVDVFDGSWVLRLRKREPVRFEDVQDELIAAVKSAEVTGEELARVRELVLSTYAPERLLR